MRSVKRSPGARLARPMALTALALACGCGRHQLAATRANMVGRYVFESADPKLRHPVDTLTLADDGTYILLQLVPRQPVTVVGGRWSFSRKPAPEVSLDSVGYPVRITGWTVRLLVDPALGYAFVKR